MKDLPMKFNIMGNEDCLNPMEEGLLFFFLINCCNNVLQASGGVSYFFETALSTKALERLL